LIKDCAIMQVINCGGLNSCNYTREKIEYMLNQTLSMQYINYKFIAYRGDDEGDTIFDPITQGGGCPGSRQAAPQPIPAKGQIIHINLYVC